MNKKLNVIVKIVLVCSALVMALSYVVAWLDHDYGAPIVVGSISGIIFLCCNSVVAIQAIMKAIRETAKGKCDDWL